MRLILITLLIITLSACTQETAVEDSSDWECSKNIDCGTPSRDFHCEFNKIYEVKTDPQCVDNKCFSGKTSEVFHECSETQYCDSQSKVCVNKESTTLKTTTSSSSTTSTTTTVKDYVCTKDSDCGQVRVDNLYCSADRLVGTQVTPTCRNPATDDANCLDKAEKVNVQECAHKCAYGMCIPEHCSNNWLDEGEEDVDCGRECPPCSNFVTTTTLKKCIHDGECGTNYLDEAYSCYDGDVVKFKVNYFCSDDRSCYNETETITYFECDEGYTCYDGENKCTKYQGSCFDCIKNRNETGIDCGGECPDCAVINKTLGYNKFIDLYNPKRVDSYRGFEFRYLDTLYNDTQYGFCAYGAMIQVYKPNGDVEYAQITRFNNSVTSGLNMGFEGADVGSARFYVW